MLVPLTKGMAIMVVSQTNSWTIDLLFFVNESFHKTVLARDHARERSLVFFFFSNCLNVDFPTISRYSLPIQPVNNPSYITELC